MDEDPDAVAEAVAEVVAVAGVGDHLARDGVGLDAGHPGPDPVDCRELRLEAHVVDLAQHCGELAGREGARAVRAVAVELGAPVGRDERPRLDDVVCWLAVRLRAVQPGRNRGVERKVVDAVGVQQLPQPPGDLALAPPDPGLGRQRLEGAVGRTGCAGDLRNLVLVLDRSERLHHTGHRHEIEAAGAEHLDLRERHDVRLEGDLALEPLRQVEHHRPPGQHRVDPEKLLGSLDVAEVREQLDRPLRVDQQCRVRRVEPGQVTDVDEARDEEPLAQRRAEPVETGGGVAHIRSAR